MLLLIAGIKVKIEPKGEILRENIIPYQISGDKADISVFMTDENIADAKVKYPELTEAECEYLGLGAAFYDAFIGFGGLMLHASALEYEGKAYLFSAPSGTGKSTHTELWQKRFGADKVRYINDDKPAIRSIDGVYHACGTPFSGKNNISANISVPIAGIAFIERASENSIIKLLHEEAVPLMIANAMQPRTPDFTPLYLSAIDGIVKNVNIYKLFCNMDISAADVAYSKMRGL
jgi:hypothetical protein